MDIRVIYFDTPFWRAEVSRLALFIGDIPFEDMRIDEAEDLVDDIESSGRSKWISG